MKDVLRTAGEPNAEEARKIDQAEKFLGGRGIDANGATATRSSWAMEEQWYGVKCILEHVGLSAEVGAHVYEERIVIVRAVGWDAAIERGEAEANEYARMNGAVYLGYCNSFLIGSGVVADGSEVYSVMRESTLAADAFVDRYYDDGTDKRG